MFEKMTKNCFTKELPGGHFCVFDITIPVFSYMKVLHEYDLYISILMWSVMAERSSAMDSSSGVVNVECCGRAV